MDQMEKELQGPRLDAASEDPKMMAPVSFHRLKKHTAQRIRQATDSIVKKEWM